MRYNSGIAAVGLAVDLHLDAMKTDNDTVSYQSLCGIQVVDGRERPSRDDPMISTCVGLQGRHHTLHDPYAMYHEVLYTPKKSISVRCLSRIARTNTHHRAQ